MHSMAIGLSAFNWGLPILYVSLVPFKLSNLDVNTSIRKEPAYLMGNCSSIFQSFPDLLSGIILRPVC